MHVLRTCDTEESVCGSKVARFDSSRLVGRFFEFGGYLDRRQSRDFLCLRVLLRQDYGVCEMLVSVFALQGSTMNFIDYSKGALLFCSLVSPTAASEGAPRID